MKMKTKTEQITKEQLVSLAKEKGFHGYPQMAIDDEWYSYMCLLQKWLREKYNVHVWIMPSEIHQTYRSYIGEGIQLDLIAMEHTKSFIKYEEALAASLLKGLESIKNNKQ